MRDLADWIKPVTSRLLALAKGRPAWGYRSDTSLASEPTALAGLALAGDSCHSTAQRAAGWLADCQARDGSVGVSTSLAQPGWPTPLAILLWKTLGTHAEARRRAVSWLLAQRGTVVPRPTDGVVGHDSSLAGWSWLPGTHSWVEPTALAILALRASGLGDHLRVLEGLRLLADRAIPRSGWNYGNRSSFGSPLRPQPEPTGLALLALAGTAADRSVIEPALDYLRAALSATRSPISLSWGVLGLSAWARAPEAAAGWLAESAAQTLESGGSARGLALLLLAGRGDWKKFGIDDANGDQSR